MNIIIILPILLLVCCVLIIGSSFVAVATPAVVIQTKKPKRAYNMIQDLGFRKPDKEKCDWTNYHCWNGQLQKCENGRITDIMQCRDPGLCDPNDPTKCLQPGRPSAGPPGPKPGAKPGSSCNWTGDRCINELRAEYEKQDKLWYDIEELELQIKDSNDEIRWNQSEITRLEADKQQNPEDAQSIDEEIQSYNKDIQDLRNKKSPLETQLRTLKANPELKDRVKLRREIQDLEMELVY